jgi:hypothetical protein
MPKAGIPAQVAHPAPVRGTATALQHTPKQTGINAGMEWGHQRAGATPTANGHKADTSKQAHDHPEVVPERSPSRFILSSGNQSRQHLADTATKR